MNSTLVVNVEDEATYWSADKPLVSDALITLFNLTTDEIGTARLAIDGSFIFLDLEEGSYQLYTAAPGHLMTSQIVSVAGSSTTVDSFIQISTVNYIWTTTPVPGSSDGEVLVTLDGGSQNMVAAVGETIDLRFVSATTNVPDLSGRTQDDSIFGSQGMDSIHGKGGDDLLDGFYGDDLIFGQNGKDSLFGGYGNDSLNGGRGDDELYGEYGHDELKGGAGEDDLRGGTGNDDLKGGNDDDVLYGNNGHDELRGGNGQDLLLGGNGDDRLLGGAGADVIKDGYGKDWMKGGAGADLFVFIADGKKDRIADFEDGVDRISLDVAFGDLTITTLTSGRVKIAYDSDILIVNDSAGLLTAADLSAADF